MSDDTAGPTAEHTAERTAEQVLSEMPAGSLNEKLGVEITEISAERVVGTMPVEGNQQPFGLLHGGASVALAESLGSVGAALHAHAFDKVAVGVDINATHHRSARAGEVTGVATPVHLGRSSSCFEVVISDENGKRVCTARITCALIPRQAVGL